MIGVISQIKAFEQGIDLHRLTASIMFGKPYDEISDDDGSSTLGDGRQSERYWGKKGNHAINYDVGYKTFALKNEMPEGEAKRIIELIHQGYPQIRGGYHQVIQNMLKKNRTVTNLFNRKRLFLGPIIPSYPNVPKTACQNTYREAYAQLPQSTTADKINEQGVEYIYYNQDLFKPIELLTQIHDSVVFQIPLSVSWTEHARMILQIKKSLEIPLTWHETKFATPCDIAIGLNMEKDIMKEFKSKDVPDDINEFASLLRKTHTIFQEGQV
jgi:DNA polymerase-1